MGKKRRALVWQRDEHGFWKTYKEVDIVEETPLAFKVRGITVGASWYPKKGMVYRFEEIK